MLWTSGGIARTYVCTCKVLGVTVLLGPQSRFGDKLLKSRVVRPQDDTWYCSSERANTYRSDPKYKDRLEYIFV